MSNTDGGIKNFYLVLHIRKPKVKGEYLVTVEVKVLSKNFCTEDYLQPSWPRKDFI